MKLILEETFDLENVIELNESTNQKTYVIKGTFSTPDKKNRNGRIYASKLWESNVAKYQNEIQGKTVNTLMEKEHPPRTTVDPWSAVAQIRKLEMREGLVYGEAELLNIPETAVMRELIDKGIKIGVSSRGVGKMKGDIVEEFNLITYDIVSTPSDYNANLQGFNESMILEGVNIEINKKGQYICTPEGCTLSEAVSKHGEDSDEVDDLKSDEEGIKTSDEKNKQKTPKTVKEGEDMDKEHDKEHDKDCKCEECKEKKEKMMKEPQSECDKKAQKLAEAFEKLAKGDKLSEDEIKFKELQEKFNDYMGRDSLINEKAKWELKLKDREEFYDSKNSIEGGLNRNGEYQVSVNGHTIYNDKQEILIPYNASVSAIGKKVKAVYDYLGKEPKFDKPDELDKKWRAIWMNEDDYSDLDKLQLKHRKAQEKANKTGKQTDYDKAVELYKEVDKLMKKLYNFS